MRSKGRYHFVSQVTHRYVNGKLTLYEAAQTIAHMEIPRIDGTCLASRMFWRDYVQHVVLPIDKHVSFGFDYIDEKGFRLRSPCCFVDPNNVRATTTWWFSVWLEGGNLIWGGPPVWPEIDIGLSVSHEGDEMLAQGRSHISIAAIDQVRDEYALLLDNLK